MQSEKPSHEPEPETSTSPSDSFTDESPDNGNTTPPTTAAKDRVPFWEKVAFGVGEPVGNWGGWMPKTMANQVLNMQLAVTPTYISLAFVIFRLWDAFTDVTMSYITDNFRSKWGRRRPFIFVGAIASGLLFPTFWFFHREWSQELMIAWFIGAGVLFYTAFTVYALPYHSMILEMSPDYNERTSVNAFRGMMAKIAAMASGWVWAITQLPVFADPETGTPDTLRGMQMVALVVGCLIIVLGIMPAIFCKERYYAKATSSKKKIPLLPSFKKSLSNPVFLIMVGLILTMTLTGAMINGFGTYVQTYYVFGGDQTKASVLYGWGSTAAMIAGMGAIPLFTWISSRIGKTKTLMIILLFKIVQSAAAWFLYNPEYPYLAVIPHIIGTPLLTGLWVVVPSMLADIVDYDELRTGERREGSFTAVFSWSLKVASTIGFGISGPLLVFTGFNVEFGPVQPEEVLFKMRMIMVVTPVIGLFFSSILIFFYPLSPRKMTDIRNQLEEIRGEINE